MSDRCKHCGKLRGAHKAGSYRCPVGKPTRIGYSLYHTTNVFALRTHALAIKEAK